MPFQWGKLKYLLKQTWLQVDNYYRNLVEIYLMVDLTVLMMINQNLINYNFHLALK